LKKRKSEKSSGREKKGTGVEARRKTGGAEGRVARSGPHLFRTRDSGEDEVETTFKKWYRLYQLGNLSNKDFRGKR